MAASRSDVRPSNNGRISADRRRGGSRSAAACPASRPGRPFQFELIDVSEAERLLFEREQELRFLETGLRLARGLKLLIECLADNGRVDRHQLRYMKAAATMRLMLFISSANIACGYHAGDAATML